MSETPLQLPGYAHVYSGKVRDLYAPVGADGQPRQDQLLLVASDRMSAYDFVLDTPIPDKGAVLTQMSLWWFDQLADLVPHHVVSTDVPAAAAMKPSAAKTPMPASSSKEELAKAAVSPCAARRVGT